MPAPNPFIKLDQFLKWQGLADTGGQAKRLIRDGLVRVNGQVETRRGRKLVSGDRVIVGDTALMVNLTDPIARSEEG